MPTLIVALGASGAGAVFSATWARRSSPSCSAPAVSVCGIKHRELVAGETGDDVGGAHPLAHDLGDLADQVVAGVVAEASR